MSINWLHLPSHWSRLLNHRNTATLSLPQIFSWLLVTHLSPYPAPVTVWAHQLLTEAAGSQLPSTCAGLHWLLGLDGPHLEHTPVRSVVWVSLSKGANLHQLSQTPCPELASCLSVSPRPPVRGSWSQPGTCHLFIVTSVQNWTRLALEASPRRCSGMVRRGGQGRGGGSHPSWALTCCSSSCRVLLVQRNSAAGYLLLILQPHEYICKLRRGCGCWGYDLSQEWAKKSPGN